MKHTEFTLLLTLGFESKSPLVNAGRGNATVTLGVLNNLRLCETHVQIPSSALRLQGAAVRLQVLL